MLGVKNIFYENNNNQLIISIDKESTIKYNDMLIQVDNQIIFKYIDTFLRITNNWQKEYTNSTLIDGNNWKLSITFIDGYKKEYNGNRSYPTNFEALERLNQELIEEVLDEYY